MKGLRFIKFLQFLIVPFVVLGLVAVTGCKNIQEREWRKAQEKNTISAYEEFLRKYPQSKFANEARVRISSLLLEERHPSFKDAKRMRIIIDESYGEAKEVSLASDITEIISGILKYAGVEVVRGKVKSHYTIKVNIKGKALGGRYIDINPGFDDGILDYEWDSSGHYYSGAEVDFVILFKAKDGYVIKEEGGGIMVPPSSLTKMGSMRMSMQTPNDAPFRFVLFFESNIYEAIYKLAYKSFGITPLISASALRDEDLYVQEAAAKALGEIGDARTVELLIAALRDKDRLVRERAAEALGEIGDPKAIEPLRVLSRGRFLGIGKDSVPNVRSAAEQALEKIEQRAKGENQ